MTKKIELLKTLVGGRAHGEGFYTAESDYDYRGVFVIPTREFHRIGNTVKSTQWIEGKEDVSEYEIGHFLHLATQNSPNILEMFGTDNCISKDEVYGQRIRDLFWDLIDGKKFYDSQIGYSRRNIFKMIEAHDNQNPRWAKFGFQACRAMVQASNIIFTRKIRLEVPAWDFYQKHLIEIKSGLVDLSSVQYSYNNLKGIFDRNYNSSAMSDKFSDVSKANDLLWEIRTDRRFMDW